MFFDNSKCFIFDKSIRTIEGNEIQIYKLNNELLDNQYLNGWATSLRNHYIEEKMIDSLREGTGLTRKDFLKEMIFPDSTVRLGAATMSGEFGEILVYDYINYVLKYYVTRTRYLEKINRNMPVSGSDVLGYKVADINKINNDDELLVAEVKTRSSKSAKKEKLCSKTITNAIIHSSKDRVRIGESLNAEKRRLICRSRFEEAKIIERFQNKTDFPFKLVFFAVAVLDSEIYSEQIILDTVKSHQENLKSTDLLIIHSENLLNILRELYERACLC